MKKIVGVLTLFLVTVIFAVTMNQSVYAYENTYGEQEVEELVDLGTYETTAYVEVFEKVYIREIIPFFFLKYQSIRHIMNVMYRLLSFYA